MTEKTLKYFDEISLIPRRSGDEEEISEYLMDFAKSRGLEAVRDNIFNVVIKKPGNGYPAEHSPVILQGHTDMVCASAPGSERDPSIDGVKTIRDGDILKADGTTLGADDGIAVAIMLALLDSNDIAHPPLECVFTVQEETGLTGAHDLSPKLLSGRRMINLDSEDFGVATVSCAGGTRVRMSRHFKYERMNGCTLTIRITGLNGGHSGMDISKNRANAIKLMASLLRARCDTGLILSINGGEADNAIPRNCECTLIYPNSKERDMSAAHIQYAAEQLTLDWSVHEPDMTILLTNGDSGSYTYPESLASDLLERAISLAPSGVRARNESTGFVIASVNLGMISTQGNTFKLTFSGRSSEKLYMKELKEELDILADTLMFNISTGSEYPGWSYVEESPIRQLFIDKFRELFDAELKIEAIHAGLECGIWAEKLPGLDAIAIGPTVRGCHTPQEELEISSVGKLWQLIAAVLAEM